MTNADIQVQVDCKGNSFIGEDLTRVFDFAIDFYRDHCVPTSDWHIVLECPRFTVSCCYKPSPIQVTKLLERYT